MRYLNKYTYRILRIIRPSVTDSMVRLMCQNLEELLAKNNRAARLIFAEAAQQGGKGRQKLAQNPKSLQQLLEATQSLILYSDPDKGN